MKVNEIMNVCSRAFHKTLFKVNEHSPEILLAVGIVSGIAATVTACRATLKVDEVVDEAKEKLDKIHEAGEAGATEHGLTYSKEDYQHDLTIQYTKTAVAFAKLYAPSVALGLISIGCILGGHHIMRKRNAAITAAFTAMSTAYNTLSDRIKEKYGEDVMNELKYGLKTEQIEETTKTEDGNEVKTVKEVVTAEPSPYAVFFDEYNRLWKRNPEYNLMFLRAQQNIANDMLISHGYLFLNDVYDLIGIDRTKIGQMVGWVYDPQNPSYVDFGIYNAKNRQKRAFVNHDEPSILLDFNVDGIITDKFEKYIEMRK